MKTVTVFNQEEFDAAIAADEPTHIQIWHTPLELQIWITPDKGHKITATNRANVRIFGGTLYANSSAHVLAHLDSVIHVTNSARVTANGNVSVFASLNARVEVGGNAYCEARNHVSVLAYREACVDAYDSVRVDARDSVVVTASGGPVIHVSDHAYVVPASKSVQIMNRDVTDPVVLVYQNES